MTLTKLISGITIQYISRVEDGKDDFGHPIYVDSEPIDIKNVLVYPTTSDDVINSTQLEGKKEVYTLAIPKTDTHDWNDVKVVFFGKTYKQFGSVIQGIEHLIPLDWNRKVTVELYE